MSLLERVMPKALRLRARRLWMPAVLLLGAATLPALAQIIPPPYQPFDRCGAIADAAARLACYDSARAQLRAAPASPPMPALTRVAPPPNPVRQPLVGRAAVDVSRYELNSHGKFTVTLTNGQVWRQLDTDDARAQFNRNGPNRVVISHGFWHSYDMRLNKLSAVFKVEPVSP